MSKRNQKKVNRFVALVDEKGAGEVAEVLGVPTNTAYQYRWRMRQRPDARLEPHHVVKLCEHYDIPPVEFRPDLWPNPEWRF